MGKEGGSGQRKSSEYHSESASSSESSSMKEVFLRVNIVALLLNGVKETWRDGNSSSDVGVRGEQDEEDEVDGVGEAALERSRGDGTSRGRNDSPID